MHSLYYDRVKIFVFLQTQLNQLYYLMSSSETIKQEYTQSRSIKLVNVHNDITYRQDTYTFLSYKTQDIN